MSPSLPLFPEPMVKMWPSSSLQAPTSDAFLGTVALAPLPLPPRPRPPLPLLFPPRPPRPALVSRPMSSGILGFSFRGISTILFSLLVGGSLVLSHELFLRTLSLERTFPLERTFRSKDTRQSCTSLRLLSSDSMPMIDRSFRRSFLVSRRCFDDSSLLRTISYACKTESVLEESARSYSEARIHPLTHVSVDRAYQAESVGKLLFSSSLICYSSLSNI